MKSVLFALTTFLLVATVSVAGDDEKLPVEVDFAPLKHMTDDIGLEYDFHVAPEGTRSYGGVRIIDLGETPEQVRNVFFKKLDEDGWKVKAVGKTKLMIYSHKIGPVRKVEFKVDTFGAKPKGKPTPTVVRVKAS